MLLRAGRIKPHIFQRIFLFVISGVLTFGGICPSISLLIGQNVAATNIQPAWSDTTAPNIVPISDITVNNIPGLAGATVNYSTTASDYDPASPTVNFSPPSGTFFPIGTTNVHYWATDTALNTSDLYFNVTVVDNESPTTPGTPATSDPQNDNTPTWTWSAATDNAPGLQYIFYWGKTLGSEENNSGLISATSFTHTTELTDGVWYMKVKAVDTAGNYTYSGNANTTIEVGPPTITASIYRVGSGNPLFAKVGDSVCVEFTTDEAITIDSMKIAGHDILSYDTLGENHFKFCYTVQGSDTEGLKRYLISVHDAFDNISTTAPEEELTFDMTKPEVNLVTSSVYNLEIHDGYLEEALATDSLDGVVSVVRTGTLNTDVVGTYVLSYTAYDRAENQADILTRTIHVTDSVALDFDMLSEYLRSQGIENNLDQVNTDNQTSFSGLYFEKYVGGTKIARITFSSPLDLSGSDTIDFLQDVGDLLLSGGVGEVEFDFKGISSSVSLFGQSATIEFFGMNSLNYDNLSTAQDLYSKLSVFDNDGNQIDPSSLVTQYGVYDGINSTYTINVAHFTKFVIASTIPRPPQIANPSINSSTRTLLRRSGCACAWNYFFQNGYCCQNGVIGNCYWVGDYYDLQYGLSSTEEARANQESEPSVLGTQTDTNEQGEIGDSSSTVKNEASINRKNDRNSWFWWMILVLLFAFVLWIMLGGRQGRTKQK